MNFDKQRSSTYCSLMDYVRKNQASNTSLVTCFGVLLLCSFWNTCNYYIKVYQMSYCWYKNRIDQPRMRIDWRMSNNDTRFQQVLWSFRFSPRSSINFLCDFLFIQWIWNASKSDKSVTCTIFFMIFLNFVFLLFFSMCMLLIGGLSNRICLITFYDSANRYLFQNNQNILIPN